jgi:hypothetical protein
VQLSPAGLAAGADDAVVQYSPVTFMLRIAACNMSDDEQEQLLFPSTFCSVNFFTFQSITQGKISREDRRGRFYCATEVDFIINNNLSLIKKNLTLDTNPMLRPGCDGKTGSTGFFSSAFLHEKLLFPSTQITTRVRCWLE